MAQLSRKGEECGHVEEKLNANTGSAAETALPAKVAAFANTEEGDQPAKGVLVLKFAYIAA